MEELRWLDPAMTRVLPIIRQVFAQYAPQGFALEFTGGKSGSGTAKCLCIIRAVHSTFEPAHCPMVV